MPNEYYMLDGQNWGALLGATEFEGFQVIHVLNATCSGHCYGRGGPSEWLTVINCKVVGSEPSKRRAKLIGEAIVAGDIEDTGDTGGRLDSFLTKFIIWDYDGPAATAEQQREIKLMFKD